MALILLIVIVAFVATIFLFMQQEKFGKAPSGERLERMKKSPHYRDGRFHNLTYTPDLQEGVSYFTIMRKFFFGKSKRSKPDFKLPTKKVNLHTLPQDKDVLVWFGHSSYYLQIDGKKFLVDPVLSGSASPVAFTNRSFAGTDVYTADDIPSLDYLLITHDHWDHLDYETVIKLKPKIKTIITGLGTGAHLEHWGFPPTSIIEQDWNESIQLGDSFTIHATPARHFSGRGFKRNGVLWMSFVIETPTAKIYIGGDSGYDTHFKTIGEKHGPFDLVLLECGQYNAYWKYIHMMPAEVVQAAQDLKARKLMPVHWGRFSLALHDWDEPIIEVRKAAAKAGMPIVHPMIGEAYSLADTASSTEWWTKTK